MPTSKLEKDFTEAMMGLYRKAGKLNPPYPATKFRSMVNEHGGKGTAEILLNMSKPSDGFTELLLRGKENLRISMEYLVLQQPWRQLFTSEQLAIARKRLVDVECELPPDDLVHELPKLPEELPQDAPLVEGAHTQVTINAFERNPIARSKCIEHYGPTCVVCGFEFGAAYGPMAEGFIHVHHLLPLSQVNAEYIVNPVTDLRPVCPNCHAVIHLNGECRSIGDVKAMLTNRR